MHLLHVVDAFTNRPFAGNPAAVCVLDGPRDVQWMQLVAREMNLAETAFLHRVPGGWSLRWFTPTIEVQLCGHATLASACAIWELGIDRADELRFDTLSGWLTCRRDADWIEMDFPATPAVSIAEPPGLSQALGVRAVAFSQSQFDYLVEVDCEATVRAARPQMQALAQFPVRGVAVTSAAADANAFDFVSRFFAPASGVSEDPVTGSAHCALGPYWSAKLQKTDLLAYQASDRGGVIGIGVRGDRILLRGQAVLISEVRLRH